MKQVYKNGLIYVIFYVLFTPFGACGGVDQAIATFGSLTQNKTGPITLQEQNAAQQIMSSNWKSLTDDQQRERSAHLAGYLLVPSFYERQGALALITSLVEGIDNSADGVWGSWVGMPLLLVALKVASSAKNPSDPKIIDLLNALVDRGADPHVINLAAPAGSPIKALNVFANGKSPLELLIELAQKNKDSALYTVAKRMVEKRGGGGKRLTKAFKLMDLSIINDAALALAQAFMENGVDSAQVPNGLFRTQLGKLMLPVFLERCNFEGRLQELETELLSPTLNMEWIHKTAKRLAAYGGEVLKDKEESYCNKINQRILTILTNPKLLAAKEAWPVIELLVTSDLITDFNMIVKVEGKEQQLLPTLVKRAMQEEKHDERLREIFLYPIIFGADVTATLEDANGKTIHVYDYLAQGAAKDKNDEYAFRPSVRTIMGHESPLREARQKQEGNVPASFPHPEILTGMLKTIAETVNKDLGGKGAQNLIDLSADLVDYGANTKVIPAGLFRKSVQKVVQKKIDSGFSARNGLESFVDTKLITTKLEPLADKPTIKATVEETVKEIKTNLLKNNVPEATKFAEDLLLFDAGAVKGKEQQVENAINELLSLPQISHVILRVPDLVKTLVEKGIVKGIVADKTGESSNLERLTVSLQALM